MHVCTDKKGHKGLRRVRMGLDGCRGVHRHTTNAKLKTRQKERFMAEHDIIVASIWGGDAWQ